jgi:hypothetical protein
VDQTKVLEIQRKNKEKLISKSKTENFDLKQNYDIREKPKN